MKKFCLFVTGIVIGSALTAGGAVVWHVAHPGSCPVLPFLKKCCKCADCKDAACKDAACCPK